MLKLSVRCDGIFAPQTTLFCVQPTMSNATEKDPLYDLILDEQIANNEYPKAT